MAETKKTAETKKIEKLSKSEIDVSQKILNKIVQLYVGSKQKNAEQKSGENAEEKAEVGLIELAKAVKLDVKRPRNRLVVMVIGNHSAGKSSFIKWYSGAKLDTGAAVVSKAFNIVTHAKKTEQHTGTQAVRYYPQLQELSELKGIMTGDSENLIINGVGGEPSNLFRMIDFIDTPGLVDGDEQYGFDVKEGIARLAKHADMTLVFLDPIGQGKCSLTIETVQKLHEMSIKPKFYLTKVDTVDSIRDLCNVIAQIAGRVVAELNNPTGWNIPYFYVPGINDSAEQKPFINALNAERNMIHDLCNNFEKGVRSKVTKNMELLKKDAIKTKELTEKNLHYIEGGNKEAIVLKVKSALMVLTVWVVFPIWLAAIFMLQFQTNLPEGIKGSGAFQTLTSIGGQTGYSTGTFWSIVFVSFCVLAVVNMLQKKVAIASKKLRETKNSLVGTTTVAALRSNIESCERILEEQKKLLQIWDGANFYDDAEMTMTESTSDK